MGSYSITTWPNNLVNERLSLNYHWALTSTWRTTLFRPHISFVSLWFSFVVIWSCPAIAGDLEVCDIITLYMQWKIIDMHQRIARNFQITFGDCFAYYQITFRSYIINLGQWTSIHNTVLNASIHLK